MKRRRCHGCKKVFHEKHEGEKGTMVVPNKGRSALVFVCHECLLKEG